MKTTPARLLTLALALSPLVCRADSSYQQSTQMTGGQFVDTLRNIPFMSKQMNSLTDPMITTTMVHGNQKAVVSRDSTEITDLDKQVIIHIDTVKKTFSVVTFADMRRMMAQMPQKMAQMQQQAKEAQSQAQGQMPQSNLQYNFTTKVDDTGVTKVVNGLNAKQQILTMKMSVTDPQNPGTRIAYTMTTEVWTTPDLPEEMKEVQDFDMRYGRKLMAGVDMSAFTSMRGNSNAAMAQMFAGKPGATEAFAQMTKELAKIQGTRILEITRMGGSGAGIAAPSAGPMANSPAASSSSNGGAASGQTTSGAATQAVTNKLGIAGSALGGMLGGFGRKKPKPADQPPAQTSTATANTPPAAQAPVDVTLMEMTTQKQNFSHDPVSASVFQVPAGFKQVPSPMEQMMSK
jgi:hypothetical protein